MEVEVSNSGGNKADKQRRRPQSTAFWNKSWWDAVNTNRVRMAGNVEKP
jgi:hypothetical protein